MTRNDEQVDRFIFSLHNVLYIIFINSTLCREFIFNPNDMYM